VKRSAFDEHRDQRIAAESHSDRALMCSAHGCPLRWSVNFGQPLCSVHNRYELHDWPRMTDWLNEREADEAFRRQQPAPPARVKHWTSDEKRAIGQRLRAALRNQGGRGWAERLRDREERGDRLNDAQRAMWRQALHRNAETAEEAQP
jgi:hypothetical protein